LDAIQTAIVQAKSYTALVLQQPASGDGKRTLRQIGQDCVGELTGSISGNVYCFGYAVHEGVCIYVNMGGPRTAVEAIRAKLSKGDIVSVTPGMGQPLNSQQAKATRAYIMISSPTSPKRSSRH